MFRSFAITSLCIFFSQAANAACEIEGATMGTAAFTGEPWEYSWFVDGLWDDELGAWVDIDPVKHTLLIPGTGLRVLFEDGSEFYYDGGRSAGEQADNLHTLKAHAMDGNNGPYTVARGPNGDIRLLDKSCSARGWNLASK